MKMKPLQYAHALIVRSLQLEEVNGIKTSEILFSGLWFLMTDFYFCYSNFVGKLILKK